MSTVALVAASDDEERETAADFIDAIFPESKRHLPLRPAILWLFEAARKTQGAGVSAMAAEAWLDLGMEIPEN